MKTQADIKTAAREAGNIGGMVNKTEVKDGDAEIGALRVDYPTLAFFRKLPEAAQERAIWLLAAKTLQHEASQQLRQGIRRDAEVAKGAKNKKGELLKPLTWTREFNLTDLLLAEGRKEKESAEATVIRTKAEAMYAKLQIPEEGEPFFKAFAAKAKGYGIAWPKVIEDVTPAMCREYQTAKANDLA